MRLRQYNIFTGTNTFREACQMFRAAVFCKNDPVSDVVDYEKEFAAICGVKHGISFGAGRMALYAILEALGIAEGDEVIIPAFTCVVVPNAIMYRGARPVYVDIEPKSFNIDVEKIEAAITPRTKALYAQHTFGVPCDLTALREIGKRHHLPIIEDAAHALGAVYQGKPVGSCTEIAFFSTDHSKVINTHLGGMVTTSDDALADRVRKIQAAAPSLGKKNNRRIMGSFLFEYFLFMPYAMWIGAKIHIVLIRLGLIFFFPDELETQKPTEYPYPCRLSALQAKLGLSQLKGLERNLRHRQKIAQYLEQKLGWYGLKSDDVKMSSWLRYSFLVQSRTRFERMLRKRFDLGIWFTSVVSGREDHFEAVHYQPLSCPVAEYVAQHIVNFPTHMRIPLDIVQQELEANWENIKSEVVTL